MDKKRIGDMGEALAEQWYHDNGYLTRAKNFRTRFGEVDLILQNSGVLVFCEVKTRRHGMPGTAALAVTPPKQRRLILAAQGYLALKGLHEPVMRFDVAEVYYGGSSLKINIIENAFLVS